MPTKGRVDADLGGNLIKQRVARQGQGKSGGYRVLIAYRTEAFSVLITAYVKNGGTLEKAAVMANHASTRTTQLYDRRRDDVSLDEVERIQI